MVRNLLFNGLIAGALTGLVVALLQILLLQPLIVEAERYETGALKLDAAAQEATASAGEQATTDDPGAPDFQLARNLLTVGLLAITWSGFGLIVGALDRLVAHVSNRPREKWFPICAAGFAAFVVAPTVGLPPELPGMPAAELGARQIWWGFAAAATFVAAMMLLISRSPWVWLASIVLMAVPHVVGAPQLTDVQLPIVPPDLAAIYASRAIAIGFIGWGALSVAMSVIDARSNTVRSGSGR